MVRALNEQIMQRASKREVYPYIGVVDHAFLQYYKTLPQFHEACSRLAVRIKELMVRLPVRPYPDCYALLL